MTLLRFALLNAAHDGANTRRDFRRELDADLVEFTATEGHLPEHTNFDGVIITGSRSSVYWDEPWISSLIEYVSEAAAADVPILGVCYGHQVLAEALGGRVAEMDRFEIGYNTVSHHTDQLFDGIDEEFTVFTSHGDAVVELPPDATLIAENDHGVHAFRAGGCWGVQFHAEYDTETARDVTDGKRDQLGDTRVDAVLTEITPDAYDAACEAKAIFDNFAAYARQMKTQQTAVAVDD